MNIYQRINEVRKKVSYLQKDKRVGEGGYLAVTHDAVTAAAREHFIVHGIVVVPILVSSATNLTGTSTAKGVPFIRYEARYRFDVVNADEPSDKFSVEIEAHAIDQGDKAPGKAISYAKKYCVLKLLEIETGDEEEGREEQHKPKTSAKSVGQDAWESLTRAQQAKITDHAIMLVDLFKEGHDQQAFEYYTEAKEKLEVEEQAALWSRLDSTQRSTIKMLGEAYKKAEDRRRKEKETA